MEKLSKNSVTNSEDSDSAGISRDEAATKETSNLKTKETVEGFETFQLFKDYMDSKLKSFKREIIDESEERSLSAFKRAKKDSDVPSFRFKGNHLQYKFNANCLDKLDSAFRFIKHNKKADCIGILQEISCDISRRNKHIRLADRSPSGWAVVTELEGDDIASGSEEERRFEKAENKALRKRRTSSLRGRGRFSNPPSSTASSGNLVDEPRPSTSGQNQPFRAVKRGPMPNQQCYFCGGFGHWRVSCPLAASHRAAQAASADTVPPNSSVKK